ncbi:hypothetical protein F8C76_03135 [Flagellimonas olearia]|uniref:Uncharacterized protein n=1 Tax=Flagellimonas olearia TaxID=552546 RepID=A0A6I1E3S9_9FLAO|nr:hypothetical protein [Allomuricauda olearia]KAB7530515.1 hypothetical protein F8C76_03135 [Allomuricauda olearia]
MKKITLTAFAIFAFAFYSCETEPVSKEELSSVNISAGIVTEDGCLEASLAPLPETVSACVIGQGVTSSTGTYWDIEITDGPLAGIYPGWCIDEDQGLSSCFDAQVISSYSDLTGLPFEVVDNFDSLNWLLNQKIIGEPSSDGTLFTYGDLQAAIWVLVEGESCTSCSGLGTYEQSRISELVSLATSEGDGFVPASGDFAGIVLVPDNGLQMLLLPYKIECQVSEPSCETAFARGNDGNTCFIEEGFNKRWGWSIGPLAEGTEESYEIYAGAGQCDISKGELVGTVDVSYVDGNVTVTYNIDEAYDVDETHTYAGNEMFPVDKKGKPTVAPGQYSIEENLDGEIYVIAHAVVCQ